MNITREEIGTLNEVIKISLSPDDYNPKVESELKKVQKTMNLPGFRPGQVPSGLVKKRFGKAILIDELNKLVSGSLENFITEGKLDILGSPIPQPDPENLNNWDEPGNFEFTFEIGLAPSFNLTWPTKSPFEFYEIEVDNDKVEKYIEDTRRRYGKFSNPEVSDENSIFYGDFAELDENGVVKEGGIASRSTLSVAAVKDAATKSKLIGQQKGAVIVINPGIAFNNDIDEISHMLNKPADQVAGIKSDFQYTIDTINQVEGADMNQEFFDKVYGKDNVTTEEAFRERVRSEIADMYTRESDMKLKHDIEDRLLQEVELKLPDLFLQKWLQTAVEKPLTQDQVEKEYPGYSRGMKLRLIENRVFRDQEMKISKEEIQEMARQNILHQFSGYAAGLNDELMQSLVNRYLEKKETVERLIETLSERKVFNYLKSTAKLENKKVTYDEFVEIVTKHQHHHH